MLKFPLVLFSAGLLMVFTACRSGAKSAKITRNQNTGNSFLSMVDEHFVKITDSLYAMTTEVTNGQYREFLFSLKAQGRDDEFKLYNVDSTQWRKKLWYGEPLVALYHLHPAYKEHPVLSVSYEGATAFCEWLTEEYQKITARKFKSIKFRLPKKEEWELVANGGTHKKTYPWEFFGLKDPAGNWMANFRYLDNAFLRDTIIDGKFYVIDDKVFPDYIKGHTASIGEVTRPVKTYPPNSVGIYDMAGNVSEMLSEKGKTKGGNWNSLGYYLRIDAPDEFDGQMMEPSPLVGFRVFAEIVEN